MKSRAVKIAVLNATPKALRASSKKHIIHVNDSKLSRFDKIAEWVVGGIFGFFFVLAVFGSLNHYSDSGNTAKVENHER